MPERVGVRGDGVDRGTVRLEADEIVRVSGGAVKLDNGRTFGERQLAADDVRFSDRSGGCGNVRWKLGRIRKQIQVQIAIRACAPDVAILLYVRHQLKQRLQRALASGFRAIEHSADQVVRLQGARSQIFCVPQHGFLAEIRRGQSTGEIRLPDLKSQACGGGLLVVPERPSETESPELAKLLETILDFEQHTEIIAGATEDGPIQIRILLRVG